MAERWERVRSAPRYRVSTHGRVCTAKGRLLAAAVDVKGYHNLGLKGEDGKRQSVKVHRLVAEAFLPNPKQLPTVHHIDANPSNNDIGNLMWASAKTQALARAPYEIPGRPVYQLDLQMKVVRRWEYMKHVLAAYGIPSSRLSQICRRYAHRPWKGHFWRYADDVDVDPTEEWRQVPEEKEGLVASSKGRIRNGRADGNWGRVLNPAPCHLGYRAVVIDGRMWKVHRLVAKAFLDNPQNHPTVNHKDGDRGNNAVENLEWVTMSGNSRHAHATGLVKNVGNGFSVKSISFDGTETVYPSQNHAAVAMNAKPDCASSIRRAMRKGIPWRGFMWERVTVGSSCPVSTSTCTSPG